MGLLDYISQKAKEIPDNAKAAYRGLLAAPEELAALFSPEMRQRVNQAMNTPATLDRDKMVGMAMDYLQTTPAGLLGHIVYHGSPHKFDKFDMSKIGTGEGAQAYGHGLYFAESPDVAKAYQTAGIGYDTPGGWEAFENLFKPLLPELDKRMLNLDPVWKYRKEAGIELDTTPFQIAYRHLNYGHKLRSLADDKSIQEAIKLLKENPVTNLYKVDIPDEAIPRMLDWDKPLSEQADVYGLFNKPALSQAAGKVDSGNTNGTGYMPQGMPGSKQVNSHSNIPLNGVMGDGMRGMGNDFQIGNGVVGLDPVDVMNGLSGKQFAPNGISSSKPMDFPLLPADGGNGIPFSVNASGAPVGGVTRAALAENLSIGGDIVRMPENTLSAIRAGAFDKLSGHDVYSSISKELGSDKAASDFLAKYNINGIRYLDGSSRGAGQGTSNFVLFDDQLPRILEVNGQPTGLLSWADEAKKAKKK